MYEIWPKTCRHIINDYSEANLASFLQAYCAQKCNLKVAIDLNHLIKCKQV